MNALLLSLHLIRSAYHNGRVNVVELHELVNVDLSRVQESVADMLKSDGQLTLVQGDLIDRCGAAPLAPSLAPLTLPLSHSSTHSPIHYPRNHSVTLSLTHAHTHTHTHTHTHLHLLTCSP
jgi:hypothetical protein